MDLVEWLREQIDHDARVAAAAAPGTWEQYGEAIAAQVPGRYGSTISIYDEGGHTAADAEHIVLWQPSRVLDEMDTKRRLLDLLGSYAEFLEDGPPTWPMDALRILAHPYRERPGFREEWAIPAT